MKKLSIVGMAVLCLFVLTSCAGMQPKTELVGNLFKSSNPDFTLRIDHSLRYFGKHEEGKVLNYKYDHGSGRQKVEMHIFAESNRSKRMVGIEIRRITDNSHWLVIDARSVKGLLIPQKSVRLNGKTWQTWTKFVTISNEFDDKVSSLGLSIGRAYVSNIYMRNIGSKTQVCVYYAEDVSSYTKEIQRYLRTGVLSERAKAWLDGFISRSAETVQFYE